MRDWRFLALGACLLVETASAIFLPSKSQLVPPPVRADKSNDDTLFAVKEGVFNQLISHANPSLGTFPQRFWWSDDFYAGPGSPVVLFTPGEVEAEAYSGYLTNKTISGVFAQVNGGAGILLEHRYWGTSTPYDKLNIETLQHLTLNNSLQDLVYFANNVELPFDPEGESRPSKAPWILTGGSYSGALTIWVHNLLPGTFWAYHGSSAVVEAIGDFWQYYDIVREGMPRNCSADVQAVIEHVDNVLTHGKEREKEELKKLFGLQGIEYDDDFTSALGNGPSLWQSHDFRSGYSDFYKFCDYVENMWPGSNSTAPGSKGVGLEKAMNGYAKWIKEIMVPGNCASTGVPEWKDKNELGCFDTHNASSPAFKQPSLWLWFLCNEPFKWWQNGAPNDDSTIISQFVSTPYWERQCGLYFPPSPPYSYGIADGKTTDDVNIITGGWHVTNYKRTMFTNGQFDPWVDATMSSRVKPGGPLESSKETPVWVVEGGIHCTDLLMANGEANGGVRRVQEEMVEVMKGWVDEFYEENGKKRG